MCVCVFVPQKRHPQIVRTGNQVKVGVEGRSEFLTFEACDEDEAAAVCNALVGHAKKHETTDL